MTSTGRQPFHRHEGPGGVVWTAAEYEDELAALDLTAADGLERWVRDAPPVPGGRARGWRVQLASGRSVHLRELAHGGLLRHLTGRRFRSTRRGLHCLEVAAHLCARGISVPAPVALHARRHGAFWHLAHAHAFVDGAWPAGRFLAESGERSRAIEVARRAGAVLRAFHAAGATHPDLHVDNLLVRPAPGGDEVWIVDLDRVQLGPPPSARRRRSELRRLVGSLGSHAIHPDLGRAFERSLLACYDDGGLGPSRT